MTSQRALRMQSHFTDCCASQWQTANASLCHGGSLIDAHFAFTLGCTMVPCYKY